MSEREQLMELLAAVPDYKIGYVLAYVQGMTVGQDPDDAFCQELYRRYEQDPERDEAVSLEDCKREWGLA